jgi:hypothetical protein
MRSSATSSARRCDAAATRTLRPRPPQTDSLVTRTQAAPPTLPGCTRARDTPAPEPARAPAARASTFQPRLPLRTPAQQDLREPTRETAQPPRAPPAAQPRARPSALLLRACRVSYKPRDGWGACRTWPQSSGSYVGKHPMPDAAARLSIADMQSNGRRVPSFIGSPSLARTVAQNSPDDRADAERRALDGTRRCGRSARQWQTPPSGLRRTSRWRLWHVQISARPRQRLACW